MLKLGEWTFGGEKENEGAFPHFPFSAEAVEDSFFVSMRPQLVCSVQLLFSNGSSNGNQLALAVRGGGCRSEEFQFGQRMEHKGRRSGRRVEQGKVSSRLIVSSWSEAQPEREQGTNERTNE